MCSQLAMDMDISVVRYSQVWEDHLLLERGLQIGPDDDVLSIGSAGCNAFSLLLQGPRSVTAVDISPAQIALLELKRAGILHLDYETFVVFMGARPGSEVRLSAYEFLRPTLALQCRSFWDAHIPFIEQGILHCGRLDAYFATFRTEHLPRFWSRDAIAALLAAPDLEAQRRFFAAGDTPGFRDCFAQFFGRQNMAQQGRDPAQFRYVDVPDVGAAFYERFRTACTCLPLPGNFYMEAFLTGEYRDLARCHPYLHPANFQRLRGLMGRLQTMVVGLGPVLRNEPAGRFSKVNLSDIFEYMSAEESENLFSILASRVRSGGRIAYWNLLVARQPSAALVGVLRPLTELSDKLWRADRSWFYRAFHLHEML